MVQVIYGDVLLLIDFCMNFFVLHTTGILLRRKIKTVCLVGASFVGGIYSVAKVFVNGNDVIDCVLSVAIGLLMCYMAFGGYRFLRTAFVFFTTAALVGGIMFMAYYFMGSYHADAFGTLRGYAYSHIPLWLFVLLAAISFLVSWCFSFLGRENVEVQQAEAIATYRGRRVEFSVLLDSGNLVKEPISGKNVVLLRDEVAKELLPDALYTALRNQDGEYLMRNHFRMVSVSGVEGKKQLYYGFRPETFLMKVGRDTLAMDAYFAVCQPGVQFDGKGGIAHPALFA